MASRPPKPPDAFLSYTRFDDQHDGGAISEFCRRLASAVRAVTGAPFDIFQDVEGIGVGEHWPGKLDQMLNEARFFIPIVTPNYFTSRACRDELEKFLHAESERARNDLVLPIYYIECDALEEDDLRAADPLASKLHERQRQDWRELRFDPFEAANVRRALEQLAREIARARRRPMLTSPSRGTAEPTPSRKLSKEAITQFRQQMDAIRRAREIEKPTRRRQDRAPSFEPFTLSREIDAPWCPELVVIPPGEFMMGSTEAERQWAVMQGSVGRQKVLGLRESVEREGPQHRVRIAYSLAVGRYPVTFQQYDHFAQTVGREPSKDWGWGRNRRPVIFVSWDDAKAYVEWLAAETGRPYRLLSEAEWEYACRAGSTTRYWWGDEISSENANYRATVNETSENAHAGFPLKSGGLFGRNVGESSEVGSYAPNPWGLYDTHGNVEEWCEDRWHDSYDGAPEDGSAWVVGGHSRRVLRGGSWLGDPWELRSASRTGLGPENRMHFVGFRVAMSLVGS